MDKTRIITIGRQFGGGGSEIGMELAEKLGIRFYDKELLAEAARQSGLSESFVRGFDEISASGLLYSMAMNVRGGAFYGGKPVELMAYEAQVASVRSVAEKGECVIVGRGADYILRDDFDVVSVFITSALPYRIGRVMKREGLSAKDAAQKIARMDKARASFYNNLSDKRWGDASAYNLCIDGGSVAVEDAVELIIKYIDFRDRAKFL